jgi:dihydroorotase
MALSTGVTPAPQPSLVLRGARVIDPAQSIDRVSDVILRDGRILAVGDHLAPPDAQVLDLAGLCVTPGWIDNHVHTYGTLGFADPDSIGIWQGVTSFVDAGGPGIASMDEFMALLGGRTVTDLYAGPYIRPMGIIGAQFTEGDIRSLTSFPIPEWLDFCSQHPGVVRYLKCAALGGYGTGPIKMSKGLAEIIGVPLYGHIGEFQMQPEHPSAYELFRISQAGDMIAHPYHNSGARILDREGRLLPVVRDAKERGVLFDIAFGSYNFSWDVAERALAQGLPPDIISSDLQQFNAIGPAYSLAHVMSVLLRLGMSFEQVIEAVTAAPAKAIHLTDRAGSLKAGLPADITVCKIESGSYEFADTEGKMRDADRRIVPVAVFKRGQRHEIDLTRCQDERNWLLQIAEDHVPAAASKLAPRQIAFLRGLRAALERVEWKYDLDHLDLKKAHELRRLFDGVRAQHDLPLRDALLTTYAPFLDSPFTMQIGLFLLHLERSFLFSRLDEVTERQPLAA